MSTLSTPKSSDWNQFWDLDRTKRFTKVSWSKKRIINVLRPYLIDGHKALDAGCGSGFFSKYFLDQGMTTTSLDYSQEALKIAEQLTEGQSQLVQDDLLNPGLSNRLNEKFHLIFTDGLFEHFVEEKQNAIMQNFLSVLDTRGVIVTVVPNRFSPWELIRPFYMPGIEEDPFVLNQLVELNERNHLKVIAKGGINTFPFAFSPDALLGSFFGMLLFTIAVKP